jgi:transcriptional regulator with XRE-family HTH domain
MQENTSMFTTQSIYLSGNRNYHVAMAITNEQTRAENLLSLLPGRGDAAELASLLGIEANYVSRMKTGKKVIGNEMARRIEAAKNLPLGWMDQPHSEMAVIAKEREDVMGPDALAEKLSLLGSEEILEVFQRAMALRDKKNS